MATSISTDTLCPLTLKSLPSSSLDVGVAVDCGLPFSDSKCAHKCTLDALVRYIQGEPVLGDTKNEKIQNTTNKGGGPLCPVCHAPIISVCDGIFASETLREKACVVCFRYGKQNYFLSVPSSSSGASAWSIFKKASTAQDRIAYVLGMSTKNGGLKILHRGMVLYPNTKRSASEISNQLIDLSKSSCKGAKPSLVVMGTRSGKEVTSAPGTASHSYRAVFFSLFQWGITFLFNTTRSVIGGIFLFAKSLFILPAHQDDDGDRQRDN